LHLFLVVEFDRVAREIHKQILKLNLNDYF
jgi:hypothetical protein